MYITYTRAWALRVILMQCSTSKNSFQLPQPSGRRTKYSCCWLALILLPILLVPLWACNVLGLMCVPGKPPMRISRASQTHATARLHSEGRAMFLDRSSRSKAHRSGRVRTRLAKFKADLRRLLSTHPECATRNIVDNEQSHTSNLIHVLRLSLDPAKSSRTASCRTRWIY